MREDRGIRKGDSSEQPESPPSRKELELWLRDLEDTVNAAKKTAEAGVYFLAAFSVQQAVEKALKVAIMALKHEAPPKVHRLRQLYDKVHEEISLTQEQIDFLGILTPVAYKSRYADVEFRLPSEIYTKPVVEEYLSKALPIIEKIKSEITIRAASHSQR